MQRISLFNARISCNHNKVVHIQSLFVSCAAIDCTVQANKARPTLWPTFLQKRSPTLPTFKSSCCCDCFVSLHKFLWHLSQCSHFTRGSAFFLMLMGSCYASLLIACSAAEATGLFAQPEQRTKRKAFPLSASNHCLHSAG